MYQTIHGNVSASLGIIDDNLKFILTNGGCNAFAKVLSQRTGWEIWHIRYYLTASNMTIIEPYHSLCRLPDGRFVDINGLHDKYDIIQTNHAHELDYHFTSSNLFPYCMDMGRWIDENTFVWQNKRVSFHDGLCPNVAYSKAFYILADSVIDQFLTDLIDNALAR